MDVILIKKIDNLGDAGETVNVSRGYARNYLVPRGIAVGADDSNRRRLAEDARWGDQRAAKARRAAQDLAAGFADVSCTIAVQASEEERLYGSVGEREIAQALAAQGREVDHKQILLEEPIKQLGVYTVQLRLHAEVEVPIKVWVVKAEA